MDNKPEETGETPAENTTTVETPAQETPVATEPPQAIGSETPAVKPFTVDGLIAQDHSGSKKWLWILISVIVVGVIAGAGWYTWSILKPTTPQENALTTSPSPTPTPTFTAETMVAHVKTLLKATPAEITKNNAGSGELSTGHIIYSPATYQIQGKKFKNGPLTSYGVGTTGDAAATAADYKTATDFLTEHSFTSIADIKGKAGETNIASSAWASDKIVCAVQNYDLAQTALKADTLGFVCGDLTSYEKAAEAIEPFYAAYIASDEVKQNPKAANDLTFGNPTIEDGVNGYKRAFLNTNNFAALFYQEPSKDWVFFTGAQSELACSKYNTPAITRAYANVRCFDETTQSESKVAVQ